MNREHVGAELITIDKRQIGTRSEQDKRNLICFVLGTARMNRRKPLHLGTLCHFTGNDCFRANHMAARSLPHVLVFSGFLD